MKHTVVAFCLILLTKLAAAQVGNWQIQIQNTSGVKETGFGYLTLSQDGTVDGYELTTLAFGVATFSGTWTTNKSAITIRYTTTLNGQEESGTFQGKFSAKSVHGNVLLDNGATGSIKGTPSTGVPNLDGTFSGSVRQSGLKVSIPETFDVSEDPDFPGVFDFSGTINGAISASGQAIAEPNGTVIGYVSSSTDTTSFTGKYSASSGTLTDKGIDENGVRSTGKFQRQ